MTVYLLVHLSIVASDLVELSHARDLQEFAGRPKENAKDDATETSNDSANDLQLSHLTLVFVYMERGPPECLIGQKRQ